LSVRRKIIFVVVSLSLVILAFGAFVSITTLKTATREGRYLKGAFERFRTQLEASGNGDLAAATFMASDPELIRALDPDPDHAPFRAPEAVAAKDKVSKGTDADRTQPAKEKAPSVERHHGWDRKLLDVALRRLTSVLAVSLDPEIVCLLDPQSEPIPG